MLKYLVFYAEYTEVAYHTHIQSQMFVIQILLFNRMVSHRMM